MVEEESMKYIALVVDHERPTDAKYADEVVEKKSRVAFHASDDVVENERPTEVKYAADEVEKKLLAALYASALVVDQARPTLVKYDADVVEKKSLIVFQESALVVEKKNPLSMPLRYEELSDVVAMTLPCAFVERRALPMFEIARLVVVALVAVALPRIVTFPVNVEEAAMRPLENVRSDVVAFPGNGSVPPPSIPQLKTPN